MQGKGGISVESQNPNLGTFYSAYDMAVQNVAGDYNIAVADAKKIMISEFAKSERQDFSE